METNVIDIAAQFTRYPAGRYRTDGHFSGERFRDDYLVPALQAGPVEVRLDGTAGYGSSFLEEAFGGLARLKLYDAGELLRRLSFVSRDPSLIDEIRDYISDTSH